jgi:hypothetical protein
MKFEFVMFKKTSEKKSSFFPAPTKSRNGCFFEVLTENQTSRRLPLVTGQTNHTFLHQQKTSSRRTKSLDKLHNFCLVRSCHGRFAGLPVATEFHNVVSFVSVNWTRVVAYDHLKITHAKWLYWMMTMSCTFTAHECALW